MTSVCHLCGVIPDNELLHADWHATLDERLAVLEERPDVTEFEMPDNPV